MSLQRLLPPPTSLRRSPSGDEDLDNVFPSPEGVLHLLLVKNDELAARGYFIGLTLI